MGYKVNLCGINTALLPKLTKKETEEILKEIKSGNNNRREEFLLSNIRLVLSVLHRFNFKNDLIDDVFQVRCLGLVKALNNFDMGHNVMFSTYAVPMIAGEIRRFLRETTPLKVSRSLRDIAYQAMQARERLREKIDDPSIRDIAEEMQMPPSIVVEALDAIADPVSLYDPAFGDNEDGASVLDKLSDGHKEEDWITRLDLQCAVALLPDTEREILNMRYFEDKTQTEVAKLEGISQAQVSRLENSAIRKIRQYIGV